MNRPRRGKRFIWINVTRTSRLYLTISRTSDVGGGLFAGSTRYPFNKLKE